MEPVSLALGVLPIVGGAVKAGKAFRQKLKVFRHYSREIQRAEKLVDRQLHFFMNEIHLLLRPAMDSEDAVEDILKDRRNGILHDADVEARMRQTMGTNYATCHRLIEDIEATIKRLQGLFSKFDELLGQCKKDESLKDCVRRVRSRVQVTFDEKGFASGINELRESNGDLKQLREQSQALKKTNPCRGSKTIPPKKLDQDYKQLHTIRDASKAFHEALVINWSRSAVINTGEKFQHTVRLFLDTRVSEDVYLKAHITCADHGHMFHNWMPERSSMFQIRSQSREWTEDGLPSPTGSLEGGDRCRKRPRVRFAAETSESPLFMNDHLVSSSIPMVAHAAGVPSIVALGDLCSILRGFYTPPSSLSPETCIGYIDSSNKHKYRHYFHNSEALDVKPASTQRWSSERDSLIISMHQLLSQHAETRLCIVDQLKLARNLVLAVLRFFSTPWFKDFLSLKDLSIFSLRDDISECLSTLHLRLDLMSYSQPSLQVLTPESLGTPTSASQEVVEEAKLQYGVRNLTLWSLGTILLQIGNWSNIVAPDDVPTVRRLSMQVSSLGPRYRDLTKKCLECDFGYGDDLSKPRLQQAVYETLVCELGEMISKLDIDDDCG